MAASRDPIHRFSVQVEFTHPPRTGLARIPPCPPPCHMRGYAISASSPLTSPPRFVPPPVLPAVGPGTHSPSHPASIPSVAFPAFSDSTSDSEHDSPPGPGSDSLNPRCFVFSPEPVCWRVLTPAEDSPAPAPRQRLSLRQTVRASSALQPGQPLPMRHQTVLLRQPPRLPLPDQAWITCSDSIPREMPRAPQSSTFFLIDLGKGRENF